LAQKLRELSAPKAAAPQPDNKGGKKTNMNMNENKQT